MISFAFVFILTLAVIVWVATSAVICSDFSQFGQPGYEKRPEVATAIIVWAICTAFLVASGVAWVAS